jgi:hypothetical protein
MLKEKQRIPIFFSTDDNYIPYLDVAIRSLIQNASKDHNYRIIILNTGLSVESVEMIKENESERFIIEFKDISGEVEGIRARLRNVYHFSIVTYYRLFIASLFPEYDKVIYLSGQPIGTTVELEIPDDAVCMVIYYQDWDESNSCPIYFIPDAITFKK